MKKIGFWSDVPPGIGMPQEHPWPGNMIDLSWDKAEREKVIQYLLTSPISNHYMGYSWCRLCPDTVDGRRNGTSEHSDGKYVWPSGFAHYLEVHGVKPPQEFIDHVLKCIAST